MAEEDFPENKDDELDDEMDDLMGDEFDDLIDEDLDDLMFDDDEPYEEDSALTIIENNLDRFLAVASVDAVFGEPIEKGDTLLIPTAEVGAAMGFGVGDGAGINEAGSTNSGSGGGGGGWNFSRPVAVIVASPEGVRIEPVVDVTKVAIAALTTMGFMLGLVMRMMRPPRR
jgi:uncharacterized spore protein YtfJ